jgi:hypothetical protein
MKWLVLIIAGITLLIACAKNESKEENKNPCPVIDKNSVPALVKAGFRNKYPSDTVITWFRKDTIGYCAYFIQTPLIKKLAEFNNTGSFILEESDTNQDGNFGDSTGHTGETAEGCECEIPE